MTQAPDDSPDTSPDTSIHAEKVTVTIELEPYGEPDSEGKQCTKVDLSLKTFPPDADAIPGKSLLHCLMTLCDFALQNGIEAPDIIESISSTIVTNLTEGTQSHAPTSLH